MPKPGMRRPDPREPHGTESNHISRFPKNEVSPVPEIQGKAKHGKAHVRRSSKTAGTTTRFSTS